MRVQLSGSPSSSPWTCSIKRWSTLTRTAVRASRKRAGSSSSSHRGADIAKDLHLSGLSSIACTWMISTLQRSTAPLTEESLSAERWRSEATLLLSTSQERMTSLMLVQKAPTRSSTKDSATLSHSRSLSSTVAGRRPMRSRSSLSI